jgi:hypothetical protein
MYIGVSQNLEDEVEKIKKENSNLKLSKFIHIDLKKYYENLENENNY